MALDDKILPQFTSFDFNPFEEEEPTQLEIGKEIPPFSLPKEEYPPTLLSTLERLTPQEAYLLRQKAWGIQQKNATEVIDTYVNRGMSVEQILEKLKQDVAQDVAGLALSQEEQAVQEELSKAIQTEVPVPEKPPLIPPTPYQGLAAILGAALFPEYSSKITATALAFPIKEQAEKYAILLDEYEKQSKARQEKIANLGFLLNDIRQKKRTIFDAALKTRFFEAETRLEAERNRLIQEERKAEREQETQKMYHAGFLNAIKNNNSEAIEYYGTLIGLSPQSIESAKTAAKQAKEFEEAKSLIELQALQAQTESTQVNTLYKATELNLLKTFGEKEKQLKLEKTGAEISKIETEKSLNRAKIEETIAKAAKVRLEAEKAKEGDPLKAKQLNIDQIRILRDGISELSKYIRSLNPEEDAQEIAEAKTLMKTWLSELSERLGISSNKTPSINEIINTANQFLKGFGLAEGTVKKPSPKPSGKVFKGKTRSGKTYEVTIRG